MAFFCVEDDRGSLEKLLSAPSDNQKREREFKVKNKRTMV